MPGYPTEKGPSRKQASKYDTAGHIELKFKFCKKQQQKNKQKFSSFFFFFYEQKQPIHNQSTNTFIWIIFAMVQAKSVCLCLCSIYTLKLNKTLPDSVSLGFFWLWWPGFLFVPGGFSLWAGKCTPLLRLLILAWSFSNQLHLDAHVLQWLNSA